MANFRTKFSPSFTDVLNQNLQENEVYRNLFKKSAEVIAEQINEPLAQLARIRSPEHIKKGDYLDYAGKQGKVAHVTRKPDSSSREYEDDITLVFDGGDYTSVTRRSLHDRRVLIDNAKLLGFNYYSDNLTDDDYARIVDYISLYWPKGGSPEFANFLGFIQNTRLDVEYLWTEDLGDDASGEDPDLDYYKSLEIYHNNMRKVQDGGNYYQTSHVEVRYDIGSAPNLDTDNLIHLFYYLAPIHLVLERLLATVNFETLFTTIAGGTVLHTNAGYLNIDNI